MPETIPYGKQNISESDIESVARVLRSDYLTQGPTVPAFEKAISEKSNAQFAVAVNSATSALHIACMALGVGPRDTVWTSPTTFVASANCARFCGASVDFVDISPQTWCMSVENLKKKLEHHQVASLPLPKVVIPVHLSGQSCNMQAISELGQQYGFSIIEDASHAIGGSFQNTPVGSCRYSDITVFSFHPVKIITSGEGGMALTNNRELAQCMTLLRSHGVTRDSKQMTKKFEGPWYYEQLVLGFNYRMTDIQAALGLSQLDSLEEFVARRNELALLYDKELEKHFVHRQFIPEDTISSRHLYLIRISAQNHSKVFKALRHKGIGVNLHYMPVHLQPYYRSLGFKEGHCPEAEAYGKEAISLPLYPDLTNGEQDHIITTLKNLI